jgi:glyoxylase-like metal-dependent hydrolase (beta-lactamase superfamily II)
MQIYKLYPRGFGANTYILTADDKTAVVIDPAQNHVEQKLKELGLTAKYVLLTHCHFDHVGGAARLQAQGAKIVCSEKEKGLVGTCADLFEAFGVPRENCSFTIDETLTHEQEREFCAIKIKTLLTPGHTAGSCCYEILENDGGRYLFTGDTLFENSVGRTDFPTGDLGELQKSLRFILTRYQDGENCVIHSGHGEKTTLATEKKYNPFLADV